MREVGQCPAGLQGFLFPVMQMAKIQSFIRSPRFFLLLLLAPLGVAFYSQYVDGYHPCELCIWQRWAYGAAIGLLVLHIGSTRKTDLEFVFPKNTFLKLSVLAVAAGAVIAVYHTGIEQKWWEGFQDCTSEIDGKMTIEELRKHLEAAPAVRCDQATWVLFGLSMAAWNAIYAACLAVVGLGMVSRRS